MSKKNPTYGLLPFKSPESWASKSTITPLVIKDGDTKRVVGHEVVTGKGTFRMPLVDATISEDNRRRVKRMVKATFSSKFIKPSYSWKGYSYNASMKDL